jgi:AcrR family transcriptional regulator
MPKQTFFNLPEAKRNAFVETALEEFAGHDYENASISQIVAKLGIAKGSFYQYFEDKRDVYLYLIDLASQERMAFVKREEPPDQQSSFFAYTHWILEMGVRFTFEYPKHNQIIYRAMFGDSPFRDEMLQQMKESSLNHIRQIINQGIAAGEIEPDLDLEIVAYLLNLITNDLSNFLVKKLEIDPQRLIDGDYSQLDLDKMRDVFTKVLEFMWYGIAKRSSK